MPLAFDNRKRAIWYRLSSFLITLLVIAVISVVLFTEIIPNEAGVPDKRAFIIGVVGCYFVFGIYRYWLNLHYLYFSEIGDKLVLRNYSLRPFSSLKQSIEIKKESFNGFTIKYDITSLKPVLILKQQTIKGKEVFPPVSLSALKKKEIKNLTRLLSRYVAVSQ